MSQFFLFFIAISIFFLLIQLFEQFYLYGKFLNHFVFLFHGIFQVIYLVPFQIFFFIFHLLYLFLEDGVLFDLIFKLFFHNFQSIIDILWLLIRPIFCLNFLQNIIELFIELLKLNLQTFVLLFLLLDQSQPQLIFRYISETLVWYFFMIFFTPYLESNYPSVTMISVFNTY